MNDSNIKLATIIFEGIKNPAYRFYFGICAFFLLSGFGLDIYGMVNNQSLSQFLGFSAFVITLIGAIAVIRIVEVPIPKSNQKELITGYTSIDNVLSAIFDSLPKAGKKVLDIDSSIFRDDEFISECRKFLDKIEEYWINGQFKSINANIDIMPKIYKSAKDSVFSTCIKAYIDIWKSDLGKELMNAHRESKAPVTRVFIFNKMSDVTEEFVDIMKYQAERDIKVLLNFENEGGYKFQPNSEKDFTIIDGGELIGCTLYVDPDPIEINIQCPQCNTIISCIGAGCNSGIDQKLKNLAAVWYFKNENRKQNFIGTRNSLLEKSKSLKDFLDRWEPNNN